MYNDKGKITKKILSIFKIVLLGLFIIIGTSYALWQLTFRQTGTNQITTSCFKINFKEQDDINIQDAYPLTDEESKKLTPYTFTITNICDTSATYQVNLEELKVDGKKLNNQYINLSLNDKIGKLSTFEEVDKTLDNVTMSHKLFTGVLKENEEKSFELRLWISDDTPSTEEIMNANFLSKITVITVYKKNIPKVNTLAYENLDTIKVDVNTISNPENETLNYYYQLDYNEEVKSSTSTHIFPDLQDGTYNIKVRVEDATRITIYEKKEKIVVAYEHVYISNMGNDTTGNGSSSSPYKTLQKAYTKVKSGGEMILLSDITTTTTTNMNIENKIVSLKSETNIYSIAKDDLLTQAILKIASSNVITINDITFDGRNIESTSGLIEVDTATLNLNKNVTVKNSINTVSYRTGAVIILRGTLNIDGAIITNNIASSENAQGGGVYLSGSTMNMYSGQIKNNKIIDNTYGQGGGVFIWNSQFNMYDGTISGNISKEGGGVCVVGNTILTQFTMYGGSITRNQASSTGGGIMLYKGGTSEVKAILKGGTVVNNTAPTGPNTYNSNGSQIVYQ